MEAQSLPRTGRLLLPRSPKLLAALGDELLVEQVRRGNDAAFEVIYDRHHRGILSFCRHMLASADEAEDAVQQTFISAYGSLRSDARDIKVKAWLYTIARNRCLSILRARREQPAEVDAISTVGLSEEVQQRSDLRELLDDMRDLPVDQRAALVLSELGDLSHAEVGAVVGCEAAKVKSLVFQARSSLIESRKAREIPCNEIREQLATLSGGALRRAPLRRHLKTCPSCAEFREDVQRQRKAFVAILPVVPSLGLKQSALAAIGIGGGGGAAGGGLAAGGGIASVVSSTAAVKIAAVVAVAGLAVGGGLVLDQRSPPGAAEAAGGQSAGAQASPVSSAGAGPGTHGLVRAPNSRAHHGAKHPAAAKTHAPERSGGVGQDRGPANSNSHGVTTQHGGAGMNPNYPSPGRSEPATASPPAHPNAPADDNDAKGDGGRHLGWELGVGNPHREPDTDRGVPPGQADHPPSGGDNGSSGKDPDRGGNGHGRVPAEAPEQLPPAL
jgi:RNA polymerase sigma factor (sigma-70 family)